MFDIGDSVFYNGDKTLIYAIGYSNSFAINEECNKWVAGINLKLITPITWRIGDIISEPIGKEKATIIYYSNGKFTAKYGNKETSLIPPSKSMWNLVSRPGVIVWKNRKQQDCEDCKGHGIIVLFSSTVDCDCLI